MYISDPIELHNARIEKLLDDFIDENTCMLCGKVVDYELFCMSPTGDGPAVCLECSELDESHFKGEFNL